MDNKSFTAEQEQILAEVEGIYTKWQAGNPNADNETAFKMGYLFGQSKGLGEAIKLTRNI